MDRVQKTEEVILLAADEGRRYGMGDLTAIFKVDEAETGCRYSVPEWLLDPGFEGVGPHSHQANEELFHVLDGEPEILIGDSWTVVAKGTFVRILAQTMHDFRNRRSRPVRLRHAASGQQTGPDIHGGCARISRMPCKTDME
jgi:mannose-6-phosphate isomerase-like protein (cupin superfamily)